MDVTSFDYSAGVLAHLMYFGVAIVAVLVFVAIYIAVKMAYVEDPLNENK